MKGIGIDIEEVERLKVRCQKPSFLDRVFTLDEQAYCQSKTNPEESFAARFAAKEALMKAFGTGWSSEADFLEIEIKNDPSGQPVLVLHGMAKAFFENKGYSNVLLSLSHTPLTAVAVVIIL